MDLLKWAAEVYWFGNKMQWLVIVCSTWQGRCRFWSLLDYILGGHIWPEKSRRDRTITQIHTIINTVIINQLLFIFHFIKVKRTPMLKYWWGTRQPFIIITNCIISLNMITIKPTSILKSSWGSLSFCLRTFHSPRRTFIRWVCVLKHG